MSRFLALFGSALAFGGVAKAMSQDVESVAKATTAPNQQSLHHFGSVKDPTKSINERYQPYKLGEVMNIAEDVAVFRFLFEDPNSEFALPPCSTLQACFKLGVSSMEKVERHYTPITPNGKKGYFDLIVKKQKHGRMTEYLFGLSVGESLSFRCMQYKLKYKPNKWKSVGLIAGGTGITPMLQVMRAALDNPEDKTNLSLLYANRDENKILLRGIIDDYASKHPDRFKVKYVIDQKPSDGKPWDGFVGHIDDQMVKATMPPPAKENMTLLCGPDKMMISVGGCMQGNLAAMSGGAGRAPPSQGGATALNNLNDIPAFCVFGRLGYNKDWVYRF